jgi:hypothetical protein
MKQVKGRNGGTLIVREKGDAGLEGAGRKRNPFRAIIREIAESGDDYFLMDGVLCDGKGGRTNQKVKVWVKMPKVKEIVLEQMKRAKHDVQAAKWLSETAYGRPLLLDDENSELPLVGFKFIVEQNVFEQDE